MENVIDTLKNFVTPDLVSQASSLLGESSDSVRSGLGISFSSILAGFLNKSNDTSLMSGIFDTVKGAGATNILSNPGELFSSTGGGLVDQGKQVLSSLFGNKISELSTVIGSVSGMKSSSASSLLSIATPLVLSFLGQKANTEGWSLSNFTNFLQGQKENVASAVPAGLGGLLGLAKTEPVVSSEVVDEREPHYTTTREGNSAWLRNLMLAAVALLAVFFLWKSCGKKPETASVPPIDSLANKGVEAFDSAAAKAKEAVANLGAFMKRKLPNDIELNIPEFGIEKKVIDFIEDKNKPVDETTWFSFDRLTFETNSATLKPESEEQLKNIVEILKAYPQVEMKLGGYTDNVGDPKDNLKLSSDRASNVKAELVKMGIDAKRISAEGYGEQHPVASNDTEEGRAKNRRIDLRITKK